MSLLSVILVMKSNLTSLPPVKQKSIYEFYEIIKRLTNYKIFLKTRVMILKSIVRSRLTYSCQTWNLTVTQTNKINSTYIQMLRKLVQNGSKQKTSVMFTQTSESCRYVNLKTFTLTLQDNKKATLDILLDNQTNVLQNDYFQCKQTNQSW